GGLGVVVVDVGRDLNLDMAGADHGRDDGFDALAQRILVIGGVFVLAAGQRVGPGAVIAAGQETAPVVDDGDPFGGKADHGGGHQMLHGPHLAAIEPAGA